MLQISPQAKIFLAVEHIDFRRGIDGLAAACRQQLEQDPFSGALFLFRNRLATTIKILTYDGQGYWLCTKRLSKGKFTWWPTSSDPVCHLSVSKLQILLWNGTPHLAKIPDDWRKIA